MPNQGDLMKLIYKFSQSQNSIFALCLTFLSIFHSCTAYCSPRYSKIVTLTDSKGKSFFCAKSSRKSLVVFRSGKTYNPATNQINKLKKEIAFSNREKRKKLKRSLSSLISTLKNQESICRNHFYPATTPIPEPSAPTVPTALPTTAPTLPTAIPTIPTSLAPVTRSLTRNEIQYLLDKAAFGLSEKEEYLIDLGVNHGVEVLVNEVMRVKQEQSGLLSRVEDRLDNILGTQSSQSPAGQRSALFDLWVNTNNPFHEKFSLLLLSIWTAAGDVIEDETFRGAFWDYYKKLRDAAYNDTPIPELAITLTRDPLMLIYLNNDLNKKGSPNENFARELMELFTLGPSNLDGQANYTETKPDGSGDIAVAARMLTGWKVNKNYTINKLIPLYDISQHEAGPHTMFLGTPFQFSGDNDSDLVKGIFEHHPSVAIYYAKEILKEYLTPNPPRALVEAFAQVIAQTGYKLGAAMKILLQSEAFYSPLFKDTVPTNSLEYAAKVSRILGLFDAVNYNEAQTQIAKMGMQFNMAPSVFWYNQSSWIGATSQIERANYIAQVLDDSSAQSFPAQKWTPAKILPLGSNISNSELINFVSSRVGLTSINQNQLSTFNDYLSRSRQYDGSYTQFIYDNSNPVHQRQKGLGVYYLDFLTPEFELR